MNVLVFLGCLGGIWFFVCKMVEVVQAIIRVSKNYDKYKDAYEELKILKEEKDKNRMGFKTKVELNQDPYKELLKEMEKERKEEEEYLSKIKIQMPKDSGVEAPHCDEDDDYYRDYDDVDLSNTYDYDEVDLYYFRDYDDVDLSNN